MKMKDFTLSEARARSKSERFRQVMDERVPQEIIAPNDIKLAEHAEVIRTLGKRAARDVVEIGGRLIECKELAGHGHWLDWVKNQFGWSPTTAEKYMNVHRMFRDSPAFQGKFQVSGNMTIDIEALASLAAPGTAAEVCEAVVERSERARLASASMSIVIFVVSTNLPGASFTTRHDFWKSE